MFLKNAGGPIVGLGNKLAAEILYEAKISPYAVMSAFGTRAGRTARGNLAKAIRHVVDRNMRDAIPDDLKEVEPGVTRLAYEGTMQIYKKSSIIRGAAKRKHKVREDPNPHKGRMTYWVPTIQTWCE